jgi:hypothetical protein
MAFTADLFFCTFEYTPFHDDGIAALFCFDRKDHTCLLLKSHTAHPYGFQFVFHSDIAGFMLKWAIPVLPFI